MIITVQGLDTIDETSVLNIKPYMQEFNLLKPAIQPAWTSEIMKNYYSNE